MGDQALFVASISSAVTVLLGYVIRNVFIKPKRRSGNKRFENFETFSLMCLLLSPGLFSINVPAFGPWLVAYVLTVVFLLCVNSVLFALKGGFKDNSTIDTRLVETTTYFVKTVNNLYDKSVLHVELENNKLKYVNIIPMQGAKRISPTVTASFLIGIPEKA